jgi:predicted RNA-binding protein with TRAM domain
MLRFLFAAAAVSALASPVVAQDAEVGMKYDITIATEESNQYVGAYGQAKIGSVLVMVPDAKVDERYSVTITAVATNQYTGNRQASCEFKQIGGDREGMCLGAP